MSRCYSRWDRDKAEALWLDGQSGEQIANIVGAPSRAAVIGHMNRRGLGRPNPTTRGTPSPWTPELEAVAVPQWLAGKSGREIAEALEGVVTARSVAARMRTLGHVRGRAAPPPARRTGRAETYSWGKGTRAVSKAPLTALVAAADAAPVDPSGLKTLLERGARECCWPVGAPDPVRGQLFCSEAVEGRGSYCARHRTGAGTPVPPRHVRNWGDRSVRAARPANDDESGLELTDLLA